MNLTLTLPFPPKPVHPNSRESWIGQKAQATALYREQCRVVGRMARAAKGWIKLGAPVVATITFHVDNRQPRDEDNLLAAIKGGLDGICDSGLIPGDSSDKLHIVIGGVVVGRERCVKVEFAS